MQLNKFYPSISGIINLDKFPEELSFIKDGIFDILDDIYFKDYYFEKSKNKDKAFYRLKIISEALSFDLYGSGFSLAINPSSAGDFSEIPFALRFEWELLRYLQDFDINTPLDPWSILDLIVKIYSISEHELVFLAIDELISDPVPLNIFVDNINSEYGLTAPNLIQYPQDPDIDIAIDEIIFQIDNNEAISDSVIEIVFAIFINNADNPIEELDKLLIKWLEASVIEIIDEIIIPDISINLDLELGLLFPRTLLIPLDENGNPISNPDARSALTCDPGTIEFSTKHGITYNPDLSFSLHPSQIANTQLTIDFNTVKFDFSQSKNIPEADMDGRDKTFTGIYIGTATIGLPKSWTDSANAGNPELIGGNILIGTQGGFSGTIGMVSGGMLSFTFPNGIEISLDAFNMVFRQNSIEMSNISGTLIIPAFKDENNNPVPINIEVTFGDGFLITAQIQTPISTINKSGIIEVKLDALTIGKLDDEWFFGLYGSILSQTGIP